ncbi:MAG: hypothetical protein E7557_04485 [Ruminococcaceae bacterium]|nr:hypothetical protein [Oscillospiraceae bacterium]
MTKTITPVSFFFGANSRKEYTSLFSSAYDNKADGMHYILKGGPGTGKSTLMKKLAVELEKKGYFVERGYCSADPNSLDIVIAPEINFSILDGTAPHTFDATYPGVTECIINLGEAWDKKYLNEYKTAIMNLADENKRLHKKASEYILVTSKLQLEAMKLCDKITDREKVRNYAERLCKREIPTRKGAERGNLNRRFLSAVTPDGVVLQYDTIVALSEKIITIEDDFSVCTPAIMDYIAEYALENGYDIYACYCPIFPTAKIEHIIIPELKLCFFTENSSHKSLLGDEKVVHATRFLNKEALKGIKERLKFNKKTQQEMLSEAVKKISVAKGIHDRLEDYYIRATDFSVIEEITENLMKEIF